MTNEDHLELEQTHALADGELGGAALESAQDHLATCERCQAELADIMQLAAMPLPTIRAGVTPLAWYRRRSTQLAGVVVVAAAATVLYLGTRNHPITPPAPTKIALASTRSMEARLAWHGAADYREYSVQRGATSAREPVSLAAMADLEKSGDLHGVGALALLGGDLVQAKRYLALAGESPEVLADHAALELQLGEPDKALMFADAALTKAPETTVATWNRALALRDLGLDHDAADAFRVIAKRDEPGWSVEAGKRADELEHGFVDAIRLQTRIFAAAKPLATTGEGLALDDARRMPGVARVELYDAMFAAPDAARIAKLRPLADVVGAGEALGRAKPDPTVGKAYLSLIVDDNPNREHVLATLRAAHANDALVLAFVKLGDDTGVVLDKDVAELSKLAAASQDPWIQLLGLEQQAARALRAHDLASAETPLLAARTMCDAGAANHRCMKIAMLLGRTYLVWQRLPEARTALEDAWKRARTLSAGWEQDQILQQLANLSVLADDTVGGGLPLVRAYAAEIASRAALEQKEGPLDDACDIARWGNERVASVLVIQLRIDEAAKELAAVACPPSEGRDASAIASNLFIRSEVVHLAGTPEQVEALRKDIATARSTPHLPLGERALLDLADGRAIINTDPEQGEVLLHHAIAEAARDPNSDNASRAIGASYATLATTAAKRGDGDAALGVLGDELGMTPRKTCVLGLAVDDRDVVTVARGTDGKNVVDAYERTTTDLVPQKVVPGRVITALQGCPDVDVIARPPYHGLSRLLPDDIAWRYLTHRAYPAGEPKGDSLVIADVLPPASLKLPHLATWSRTGTVITAAAATPSRVLAAIGSARDVIIHAHGLADHGAASYLALSPEPDGRYALTAGEVEHAHFASNPIVILAACEAARAAPVFHARWSLPAAFVTAGAKAVIAPTTAVPDTGAAEFFDELRARAAAGESAAVVLRDLRKKWSTRSGADWVSDVVVFE